MIGRSETQKSPAPGLTGSGAKFLGGRAGHGRGHGAARDRRRGGWHDVGHKPLRSVTWPRAVGYFQAQLTFLAPERLMSLDWVGLGRGSVRFSCRQIATTSSHG
jgi:hypothetical protein